MVFRRNTGDQNILTIYGSGDKSTILFYVFLLISMNRQFCDSSRYPAGVEIESLKFFRIVEDISMSIPIISDYHWEKEYSWLGYKV